MAVAIARPPASWQSFVDGVMRKANRGRGRRVTEDMEATRALNDPMHHDFAEKVRAY